MPSSTAFLLALALPALALPAAAQAYVQDARAVAVVPAMLGRGDAGVALPTRETAFFVNPAHVAATEGGFHLSLGGLGGGLSADAVALARRVFDQGTAIDACIGGSRPDPTCSPTDALDATEVAAASRRPADIHATVLGPSFSFRAGAVGVSAGTFLQSGARVQSTETATGDSLYAFMQTDGIGALTVSAALPGAVTLGAGARYVHRFASVYDVDAAEIDGLGEPSFVEGGGLALDAGAFWRTPLPGLAAGLAVYNLGGAMDYVPSAFFDLVGSGGTRAAAERVAGTLDGRDGQRSFRAGLAYRPALPGAVSLTVLADYVSASTTAYVQPVAEHVRLGAELQLTSLLAARAGFGGGGPAAGATLNLRVLKLDYALYTRPSGRIAGEDGGFRHALLVRLGLD